MSTRTRTQQQNEYYEYSEDSLADITDEDIELFLAEQAEDTDEKSFWNLPTIAGFSTIGVAIIYLLQQVLGLPIIAGGVAGLAGTFSLIAGILILLFGFGILKWKPKKSTAQRNTKKTIGRGVKSSTSTTSYERSSTGKKTLRKSSNRKVAGVAAGIAEYFNLDPTLVRIGFVAAIFLTQGIAIPAYIIASIVLPNAERPPKVTNYNDKDRIRITRD